MEAKIFLNQLKKIDKLIENKIIEQQQYFAIATKITSSNGGERVQASSSQQKMADAMDKYIDIGAEVKEEIASLIETKKDIIQVIETLNAAQYDILHKVYVQYMTFDNIAYMYNRSYSSIRSLHRRAIKNVQKILDERETK